MFFIYRLTDGEQDYYGQTENPKRRAEGHNETTEHSRSRLLDKSKMKLHIIHRLYTQEEADETEAFYQLNFECVNRKITGRTYQEYNDAHKKEAAEYYKQNKEKRSKKFNCVCGGKYTRSHKLCHLKTKKHQKYIQSIKNKK